MGQSDDRGGGASRAVRQAPRRQSPRSAALKAAAFRTLGAFLVAGLFWLFGLQNAALVIVLVAISLAALTVAVPAVGTAIDSGIAKVTAAAGRSTSALMLGGVFFLVIMPVSIFLRIVGRDPLARSGVNPTSTWTITPRASDPSMARRQFSMEPNMPAGTKGGRADTARFLAKATVSAAVLILALDLLVGTAIGTVVGGDDDTEGNPGRASLPAMVDQDWAADYFREFGQLKSSWVPLLGMARDDHSGRYINITDRARRTYVAEGVSESATSVYFFGGSTTFGTGQRDLYTIPSYVARLAEDDGKPVRVTNYGQGGWVLWQELALLVQLLSAGRVPDVAIFYNGHNEVGSQVQDLTTQPSYPRAKLVKGAVEAAGSRGTLRYLGNAFTSWYAKHSAIARFGGYVRSKVPKFSDPASQLELAQARARNAVTLHEQAVGVIEGLAKSYGFDAVFVWQPNAFTAEGGDAERFTAPDPHAFGPAYRIATSLVGPPVINLSDAFDGVQDPVFIDNIHTNELGAQVVAQAIYPHLRQLLRQEP